MSIYEHFSEEELVLLRARAQRIGDAPRDEEQDDVLLTVLVVTVQGETYAFPIDSITAVYENIPITPIPCVPPFVAGVSNIRGHIIPVLNLATLLGVSDGSMFSEDALEENAFVVAANETMTVAFFVEVIGEVTYLLTKRLTPVPATLDIPNTNYLQGTLPEGTVLLDIETILSDPALVIEETIS